MAGHLRLMVKKVLAEAPASGYEIVKKIEEKTGWKPSYGSMYPLLDDMAKEKLLSRKKKGRKKIYSLTAKGKKRLDTWEERKEEFHDMMKKNIKVMCEMTGEDPSLLMQVMDRMGNEKDPLAQIMPEIVEFRKNLFKLIVDDKIEKHSKELRQMFRDMTKKLRKMQ